MPMFLRRPVYARVMCSSSIGCSANGGFSILIKIKSYRDLLRRYNRFSSRPRNRNVRVVSNTAHVPAAGGVGRCVNGWLQPRLLQRRYSQLATLKRELQRLQETVNTQHPQRRLQGLTPAEYRRRCSLHKLPPDYMIPHVLLPMAAGRITFIRQVTLNGKIHLLSQTFKVGKRLKGEYVKVVLDTQRGYLTVYRQGRICKRWPYPFLKK